LTCKLYCRPLRTGSTVQPRVKPMIEEISSMLYKIKIGIRSDEMARQSLVLNVHVNSKDSIRVGLG